MTNIDNINESGSTFSPSQAKGEKNQTSDIFQDALSKALEPKETPEMESPSASALKEISSVGPPAIMSLSDNILGKTDTLLGLLDAYSSKLKDPSISLKSIAPDLERISTNAINLEKDAQTLTDKESSLKQIAAQTIVTAQTEYLKFHRGDYSA